MCKIRFKVLRDRYRKEKVRAFQVEAKQRLKIGLFRNAEFPGSLYAKRKQVEDKHRILKKEREQEKS
ncbi:hypothetical protein TNCT_58301 [Trichonephila clavata]|uniref:Uncharacterized protein n=1 Tax=Trichonephila clavata TaxID=2740835 RepID=A0A8X6LHL2_TRICU|nr:hypothetical protein TNCT_58301 [Trichonephila clavata]